MCKRRKKRVSFYLNEIKFKSFFFSASMGILNFLCVGIEKERGGVR